MTKQILAAFLVLMLSATAVFAQDATEEAETAPATIVDVATDAGGFGTLVAAVDAAGLTDTLATGEFTVFAPTNGAFETLLTNLGVSAEDLLADTDLLTSVLTYHVVEGSVTFADLEALAAERNDGLVSVATVNGAELRIQVDANEDTAIINEGAASITQADILASNGVIHVIDNVLLPPVDMEDDMDMAMATEEAMDMEDDMDMAMATEEAMDMEDDMDMAMATEEAMDMEDDMDMAMATEEAMDMEDDMDMAMATEEAMDTEDDSDIVSVASSLPDFTTLVAAVEAAELVEPLSAGEFTVFAPTNGAFETLLTSMDTSAEELLAETDLLTSVLTYHVVEGTFTADDLTNLIIEGEGFATLPTLQGGELTFSFNDEDLIIINDGAASVVQADVAASNGVIHVLDNVLLPPADMTPATEEAMEMEMEEDMESMEMEEDMDDMDDMEMEGTEEAS